MKYFLELKKIFRNKVNWVYFISISLINFWILRALPHLEILWDFWFLDGITFSRWFEFFWEKTILTMKNSLLSQNLIAFIFPILVSLNIILFKEFYQKQKVILKSKGFWGALGGIFFGLFGVGCAACSGLLLAPLISILGLTDFFNLLPRGGSEIGYLGLILLVISNLYLIKKLTDSLVCKD